MHLLSTLLFIASVCENFMEKLDQVVEKNNQLEEKNNQLEEKINKLESKFSFNSDLSNKTESLKLFQRIPKTIVCHGG